MSTLKRKVPVSLKRRLGTTPMHPAHVSASALPGTNDGNPDCRCRGVYWSVAKRRCP
jgi:hypothetical protein